MRGGREQSEQILNKVREQGVQMSGEEHPRPCGESRDPGARAPVVVPREKQGRRSQGCEFGERAQDQVVFGFGFILYDGKLQGGVNRAATQISVHFPVVTRLLLGRQARAVWREGTRAVGRSRAVQGAGLEQHGGGARTGWIPDRF